MKRLYELTYPGAFTGKRFTIRFTADELVAQIIAMQFALTHGHACVHLVEISTPESATRPL